MSHWELIHSEQRGIFKIDLYATPEDIPLESLFELEDVPELQHELDSGESVHFVAKVTASVNGIELGEDYLGSCFYKDYSDFYNEKDGYYTQMADEAIRDAREKIELIQQIV